MNASARDRLEQALAKIADPKGEGARACLTVYADAARAAADALDAGCAAARSACCAVATLDAVVQTLLARVATRRRENSWIAIDFTAYRGVRNDRTGADRTSCAAAHHDDHTKPS